MSSNHFGSALRATGLFAFFFLALNFGTLINAPPSYGQRPDQSDEENMNTGEFESPPSAIPAHKPNRVAPPTPETRFEKYIKIGDEALFRNVDFNTALINYRRAVKEQANNQISSVYIRGIETILANKGSRFTNYMRAAFVAYRNNDYHTSLINFRRASKERPQDAFASLIADGMAASMKWR